MIQTLSYQKTKEIGLALGSIPLMGVLTTPIILGEVYGYSFLYDNVEEYGWPFFAMSAVTFLLFTDCLIYWIHRGLHHPLLYSTVHKPHHWWKVPTPFASHAFHPLDGFLQSVPYHIYVFCFPIHKWLYLGTNQRLLFIYFASIRKLRLILRHGNSALVLSLIEVCRSVPVRELLDDLDP
jgi:lathosterol oxidase